MPNSAHAIARLRQIDEAPVLLFVPGDVPTATGAAVRWAAEGVTVRHVRGSKCRTVRALFDEFAAALQFPFDFVDDWASFTECLSSLDWLPGEGGIAVLVLETEEFLRDEPRALPDLATAYEEATTSLGHPVDLAGLWGRQPVAFHVVLQVHDDLDGPVRAAARALGCGVDRLR